MNPCDVNSGFRCNLEEAEDTFAKFFSGANDNTHTFHRSKSNYGDVRQKTQNSRNVKAADEIFAEIFSGANDNTRTFHQSNSNYGDVHQKTQNSENVKAATIESKLVCSLEELFKGARRKMRIARVVLDEFGRPKTVEEILEIDIKPGWKKGTKITFSEKGNQQPGVIPADLSFVVEEKPHPVFERDGNDLVIYQKISLLDALTGYTLDLKTLDGRNLTIPLTDIVKPNRDVVIQNEGMPISKDPSKKGNLRIKFDIKFPSKLNAEQKCDLKRALGGGDRRQLV